MNQILLLVEFLTNHKGVAGSYNDFFSFPNNSWIQWAGASITLVKWDGIGHELALSSVFVVLSVYQRTRFMNTYFFVEVISRSSTWWTEEMDWAIVHATSKAMQPEVYRMNLSGAVYFIWQERNCRIFQHKEMTIEVIIRNIIREIHCRGTG
ncbi:hypothetical protein H5410_012163 [Solanum commersonii]|uniref:Uncharacterized protein n=1 Tax=Solanum commersonii TaxID=4109 RepID=A0A9J6ARP1_SOLCO|nr:hypothetical protein H5410_012163 [Solanum commersonii]